MLAWRWTDRVLGLISTVVLARLLLPSDFGVIALASVVIGFVDTVFDLGVHIPLIQGRNPSREDFDTAWTLRLLQALAACVLLVLGAEPAAVYLGDPRLAPVIQILAVSLLLAGLENIGVIHFQRDLRFDRDYWLLFARRISGLLVSLILAWYWRTYWALVAGTIAGRAVGLAASYAVHQHRPRLTLRSWRQLWSFSQWTLVRNMAAYVESKIDKMVVGKHAGPTTAGAYATAEELALVPVTEFFAPLGRALLPVFASANNESDSLRRAYLDALTLQCLIGIPAAVGIHCVAPELVAVLLGEKWFIAIPFVSSLALVGIPVVVSHAATYVLMAKGRMALFAGLTLCQVSVFACLLVLASGEFDAGLIPWYRLLAALAVVPPVLFFLLKMLPGLKLVHIGTALIRPTIAAIAMYAALVYLSHVMTVSPAAGLLLKVVVGVLSYTSAIVLAWLLAGRPAGPESSMIMTIASRMGVLAAPKR